MNMDLRPPTQIFPLVLVLLAGCLLGGCATYWSQPAVPVDPAGKSLPDLDGILSASVPGLDALVRFHKPNERYLSVECQLTNTGKQALNLSYDDVYLLDPQGFIQKPSSPETVVMDFYAMAPAAGDSSSLWAALPLSTAAGSFSRASDDYSDAFVDAYVRMFDSAYKEKGRVFRSRYRYDLESRKKADLARMRERQLPAVNLAPGEVVSGCVYFFLNPGWQSFEVCIRPGGLPQPITFSVLNRSARPTTARPGDKQHNPWPSQTPDLNRRANQRVKPVEG